MIYHCARLECGRVFHPPRRRFCSDACSHADRERRYRERQGGTSTVVEMRPGRAEALQIVDLSLSATFASSDIGNSWAGWIFADDRERFTHYPRRRRRTPIPRLDVVDPTEDEIDDGDGVANRHAPAV